MAVTNAQGDTPLDLASRRAMKVCVQFLEMAMKNKLPRSPTPNTSLHVSFIGVAINRNVFFTLE